MSELYDPQILKQLQTAAIAAVGNSTQPDLPLKVVGIGFEVPNDQKYLELVWIPNNVSGDFWGNEKNYQGMFRMILHWPNDGAGPYTPFAVLASICSAFDKQVPLSNIIISANPDSGGVLEQGSENLYPAMLRYQCFRS